jgi:hypothetical protein
MIYHRKPDGISKYRSYLNEKELFKGKIESLERYLVNYYQDDMDNQWIYRITL